MKTCNQCKEPKPYSEYYKQKGGDGYASKCKICIRLNVRLNSQRVGSAYDFSVKGIFRVIYKTQKRHQKLRGHGDMPYSKDELRDWCMGNGFMELYDKWTESGHDTKSKPSVDRIDTLKGYSIDNIRLVTWQDNRDAQANDIITATGSSGKRCKAVIKMDDNHNQIKEYVSLSEVLRCEGYSVHYPIKKGTKCKKGFYWKYKI